VIHQGDTYLTDDFLLEVKCGTDDGDGVVIEITAVLPRGGVHSDEFLQLWR
jgi:hypothetical protein